MLEQIILSVFVSVQQWHNGCFVNPNNLCQLNVNIPTNTTPCVQSVVLMVYLWESFEKSNSQINLDVEERLMLVHYYIGFHATKWCLWKKKRVQHDLQTPLTFIIFKIAGDWWWSQVVFLVMFYFHLFCYAWNIDDRTCRHSFNHSIVKTSSHCILFCCNCQLWKNLKVN